MDDIRLMYAGNPEATLEAVEDLEQQLTARAVVGAGEVIGVDDPRRAQAFADLADGVL